MNNRDRELMERYIYQVVRRLPGNQREEVRMELQELISDMEEAGESMEDILTRMGDPAKFAEKYQDRTHCLIGPEYYDNYIWLLRIVLICVSVTVVAVSAIQGIREGFLAADTGYAGVLATVVVYSAARGFTELFASCLTAFGGVTLAFAVMERRKIKVDMKKEKKWSVNDLGDNFSVKQKIWTPNHLSPIPHKKAVISRADSVVGIVFIVIFGVLLIFVPQIFGAVLREGEVIRIIPVFNLEQWDVILPLFILSLAVALADEALRLVVGHYCKVVMISSIASGILQIILACIILKVFPFWNPDFAAEIAAQPGDQISPAVRGALARWDGTLISNAFLVFIIAVTALEIGSAVYHTLRYGVKNTSDGFSVTR